MDQQQGVLWIEREFDVVRESFFICGFTFYVPGTVHDGPALFLALVTDTGDPVDQAPVEDTAVPPVTQDGEAQPATEAGDGDEAGTDADVGNGQVTEPEPEEDASDDGPQEQQPDNR